MSIAAAKAKGRSKSAAPIETDAGNVVDILHRLHETTYNDGYKPEQQDVVLMAKEKIIGTMGNFVTISGQPKARKSTITHAIIASAISGTEVLAMSAQLPRNKNRVVLFDTEQSRFDFYSSLQRMKRLASIGTMPANFTGYNTRHFKPAENRMALAEVSKQPDVGMIVIDGMLDMIMDFNDIVECKYFIDELKYITEKNNVFVICVLHQSKGSTNTLGHLGSMSDRFSQATLDVIKHDDGVTEVKPKFMRSDEHFEPIHIYWDHRISNYNLYWTDYTPPKTKAK
jgi:archaellum biogenesis ATPase FlaH